MDIKVITFLILGQFFIGIYANIKKDFCNSLSKTPTCDPTSKYSPIDGVCNNLKNPYIGAANTRYKRLLRTRYADNISKTPKSVTGAELPNPRLVSLTVFGDRNISNPVYTVVMAQFAQLIAHDFTQITSKTKDKGCCLDDGQLASSPDQNCFYIPVPANDTLHRGQKCLDFTRSITDRDLNCPNIGTTSAAQQINAATAAIDLSHIYGTSKERLAELRTFEKGKLKMLERDNSTWPLYRSVHSIESPCFGCEKCYLGGDSRINQNPGLTALSILFMREHNRLAEVLSSINPNWSDEKLFQEARRINIAEFQNIAYYGWFSTIAGEASMKKFGFFYETSGGNYANDYNSSLDMVAYNEFAAAMFRLPHTLIDGNLRKLSESQTLEGIIKLSYAYFRPSFIEGSETISSLMRGMVSQPAQLFDSNYDEEIRSYLFRNGRSFGNDLKAIDIQRGRDHGLGSYNDLRVMCQLPRAVKWEDFGDHINQSDINNLKKVYAHVDDVDLNVGASLEKPYKPGLMIGFTYVCLLIPQIRSFHSADRFWFETSNPVTRFTPEQLTEIRKSNLAKIICDNAGNVQNIQKNVFGYIKDVSNPRVPCSEIPSMNLTFFKE